MYDVIVIGAGFAGLTAARDQRDAGRSVLVLEARDRIGGRTHYDYLEGLDQKVELGGTWVVPSHQPHVAREVARYGLEYTTSPEPENFAWHFNGTLAKGGFPVPFEEIPELERAVALIIEESRRIEFGRPFEEQALEDLDISFAQWLRDKGIEGTTKELFNSYGAGLCFGIGPDDVSALHVISWVTGCGNSVWKLFNGPTIKLAKGTASLYNALADGLDVRLSSPVARVEQDGDSVTVTTTADDTFTARAAVIAVPLNTWADIDFAPALCAGKQKFAEERLAGRDVKVWVQARNVPRYFASLAWNAPLEWLSTEFERDEGSIMVGFGYEDGDKIDPADRASVERAVKTLVPEAEVVTWWSEDWNGDPYSLGTWTAYRPGQITRLAADSRRAEGRLVFANADVAVGFSGWIEGAIESGTAAASALAPVLGD
ncbi:flavin monoamine oxidase family protein [Streptomyces shenzhenensis]|uniref:flavin monoamine oxidase family protein n=1 Tax=Streptomyces shenzhenensis TaxID=943815 RepID=UPI0015F0C6B2|nr:NAD(P)/FAD-dependent oxidoreductase [Streptomyces shenzhenensis]